MTFRGDFVNIMCRVNPEYQHLVVCERGQKIVYQEVLRILYVCIESALLWYNHFATTLKDIGFKLNPYDQCVANKTITIYWYVDKNKASHTDEKLSQK